MYQGYQILVTVVKRPKDHNQLYTFVGGFQLKGRLAVYYILVHTGVSTNTLDMCWELF